MTCKRCEDIHTAQKDGKTQESCKCNCHNNYTTSTTGGTWLTNNTASTSDNINFTNTTGTITFSDDDFNLSTNCHCMTSSHQCDECKFEQEREGF
jgi:hypothetical protein